MATDERRKRYEDSAKGKAARKAWRAANLKRRRQTVREAVRRFRKRASKDKQGL